MSKKKLFVTVGTTKFDSLIKHITSSYYLEILKERGFTNITLQIGRGEFEPPGDNSHVPQVSYYRFKDSISDDIANADLVISHAGIGSITDCLTVGKPMLVVINEELMDNHQTEVAERLAQGGHLLYCTVAGLGHALRTFDWSALTPFSPGQPEKLEQYLDKMFGFV